MPGPEATAEKQILSTDARRSGRRKRGGLVADVVASLMPVEKCREFVMKCGWVTVATLLTAGLAMAAIAAPDQPPATRAAATQKAEGSYVVTGTVALTGEGPWGHVAQDAEGKRLYVLSTDWMRVMDPLTGKMLAEMGVGNGA